MSQVTFENPTGSGTTSGFRTNGQLRITYTAGGGSITITAVEGKRKKGTETHQNKVPCTATVGGQTKSWTVPSMKFNTSGWTDFGFPSTTFSGLSGNTSVVFKFSSSSGVQGTFQFSGTIDAGSPTPSYSFNLNILEEDGSEPYDTGAAGDVEQSVNGGGYVRVHNEQASSYLSGTTLNYRNFSPGTGRKLVSVSGITPNDKTGPWSTTVTGNKTVTFQVNWNRYDVAYNANGGTGAPSTQQKVHGTNLTLSSTKPTRANSTGNGYTVTFNANGGSVSPTTKTATNTYSYSFNNWKATNGTTYNPGGTYSANEGTTMTAQWNTTTTRGSITTPTATRSNGTATRTVTFDAATNGGTCPTASLNSTATVTYTANGWYTATSGGTKRCANGGSYTPAATETVYQQWGSTTGSYSAITLPAATKANSSAPSRVVTIDANKGSTTINSRTSNATITYTQSGWWTAASGGTNRGNAGATYTPPAAEKIYAQFNSTIGPYSEIVLPTESECTRPNHNLLGFSTKKFGKPMYEPGEHIVPEASMLLYAIWDGEDASIYYKSSGNWYLGKPYYKYNGSWYTIAGGWYKINGRWYPFAGKKAPTATSTNVIESKLDGLLNR